VKLPQLTAGAEIIEWDTPNSDGPAREVGRRSSQAASGLSFVAAHHESREPVRNHDSVEAGEPAALCHRLAGVTTAMTSSREVEYATMTDRHRPMTTGRLRRGSGASCASGSAPARLGAHDNRVIA